MSVFKNIIPGLTIVEERVDEKALVGHAKVRVAGNELLIHLISPHRAPPEAVPLCGSIYKKNEKIWGFNPKQFSGRVHLVDANGVPVMAFVGKTSEAVEHVKALEEFFGTSLGLKATITAKMAAAKKLDVHYRLNENEELVKRQLVKGRLAVQEAAAAAAQVRREQKAARKRESREQLLQAIAARPVYTVVGASRTLTGKPVEEHEWEALKDGTWCVLVEGYDQSTGLPEALVEHFVVSRRHGRASRAAVTSDIKFPERKQVKPPEPLKTVLMDYDDDIYEVPVYAASDIAELAKTNFRGFVTAVKGGQYAFGNIVSDGNAAKAVRLDGAKLNEKLAA